MSGRPWTGSGNSTPSRTILRRPGPLGDEQVALRGEGDLERVHEPVHDLDQAEVMVRRLDDFVVDRCLAGALRFRWRTTRG